jgi:hypothetical protein
MLIYLLRISCGSGKRTNRVKHCISTTPCNDGNFTIGTCLIEIIYNNIIEILPLLYLIPDKMDKRLYSDFSSLVTYYMTTI